MQKFRFKLPPPHYLVTFEAAARRLSFTLAAKELNVTRVAVSQQVRALEEFLGVALFQRLHRVLKLTEAGERYFEIVSFSLERLLRGTLEVSKRREDNTVTITTTTGFSSLWLLPHIGHFRQENPDINLRFLISDDYLNLSNEGVDIAIRYGDHGSDLLTMTPLTQEYIFPVASREFAMRHPRPEQPADFLKLPLIHLEGRYDVQTTWAYWFKQQGIDADISPPSITVNTFTNLVQAVVDGQGVALLGLPLLYRHLEDGSIVRMIDVKPLKRRAFFVAVPRDPAPSRAAQCFCDWIKDRIDHEINPILEHYGPLN